MTFRYDQDTIDEYRKPEYHGEHISFDEGAERYETEDPGEFVANAVDSLCGADEIPEPLKTALLAWYRTTNDYAVSVQHVVDDAAKPY
jgi:hypothetical protein